MKIVLIGNGNWGKNYITAINSNFPIVKLIVADRYNWKSLIDIMPEGVIVATPPETHIDIASYALNKGIPTMIEKPLCLSLDESKKLKDYSAPILVNHLHLFSEGYQKIKRYCPSSAINKIVTNGFNNGPNRNYSSLWDYGPHDLSMILDITGTMPSKIDICEYNKNLYNLEMQFHNIKTYSKIGSGGDHKERNILINYDGIDFSYNDLTRPSSHKAPLLNSIYSFISIINSKNDYRSGLNLSFQILEILEFCQNSLNM